MTEAPVVATARIGRHPLHAALAPVPIVCFAGALFSDIAYWRSAEMMWADFSAWLLSVGVVVGSLAAIAGLVDLAANPLIRRQRAAWRHTLGSVVALALGVSNMLVHTRDAWTSVVPIGLALSIATVVVMIVTGWLGRPLDYDRGVGVVR